MNKEKIPFIKGILNQELPNLSLDQLSNKQHLKEYNDWTRSHGGNWNSKFNIGNEINKTNISKLKLLWKYASINKTDKKIKELINLCLSSVK